MTYIVKQNGTRDASTLLQHCRYFHPPTSPFIPYYPLSSSLINFHTFPLSHFHKTFTTLLHFHTTFTLSHHFHTLTVLHFHILTLSQVRTYIPLSHFHTLTPKASKMYQGKDSQKKEKTDKCRFQVGRCKPKVEKKGKMLVFYFVNVLFEQFMCE